MQPKEIKRETYATVYSDVFSCYQPCSYHMDSIHNITFDMNEEYEELRSGEIEVSDCHYDLSALLEDLPAGEYDVDSQRYANELMKLWYKGFFDYFETEMKSIQLKGRISVCYLRVHRPKEYNFEGDAAVIDWFMDAEASNWLYQYILKNKDAFDTFLHEQHGRRDGFIPYEPVTADDWLDWFLETENGRYHRDIGLVIGRAFDFILFGQKNGKYSKEILEERTHAFEEQYWNADCYEDGGLIDIQDACIAFYPNEPAITLNPLLTCSH